MTPEVAPHYKRILANALHLKEINVDRVLCFKLAALEEGNGNPDEHL